MGRNALELVLLGAVIALTALVAFRLATSPPYSRFTRRAILIVLGVSLLTAAACLYGLLTLRESTSVP
jgi:hypothetical protein